MTPLNRTFSLLLFAGLTGLAGPATSQSCTLVRDIQQTTSPVSSDPTSSTGGPMAQVGNNFFFLATTRSEGRELWKTDGTPSGTVLVKDIVQGPLSPLLTQFVSCGNQLFFLNSVNQQNRLWVSDGTANGTFEVARFANSSPTDVKCLNGTIYFLLRTSSSNQLWSSDGTRLGTRLIRDFPTQTRSLPGLLGENSLGTRIYFTAPQDSIGSELWASDGTTAGTTLVRDINPGSASSNPYGFVNLGSITLFGAQTAGTGIELWRTDGTASGTFAVADIATGTASSSPQEAAVFAGRAYFSADDGSSGRELWRTDGTAAGTVLVSDLQPGATGSFPRELVPAGGNLFYVAQTQATGRELFVFDGTAARITRDLVPGALPSNPGSLTPFGAGIVFGTFSTTTSQSLYVSDGTAAGTQVAERVQPGFSTRSLILGRISTSQVLFAATQSNGVGRELFTTGGTPASTALFLDVEPGVSTGSSDPEVLGVAGGITLFFSADDDIHGRELWLSEGFRTALLKDINPGARSSGIQEFRSFCLNGKTLSFFQANDGQAGSEPWVTDGTPNGTHILSDLQAGFIGSNPAHFALLHGRVYFTATLTPLADPTLWSTDGTAAGTRQVSLPVTDPGELLSYRGRLYFPATDASTDRELWSTDGTSAGTRRVANIFAAGSSLPERLTRVGDRIVFRAFSQNGLEAWATDGTSAGTREIVDSAPGAAHGSPGLFTANGNQVFFVSAGQLWGADPVNQIVRSVQLPGSLIRLMRANNSVYANVSGPTEQMLVRIEGLATGAQIVFRGQYVASWPGSSTPAAGGMLLNALSAAGPGIYYTDGVTADFYCDTGGTAYSPAAEFTVCDGYVYFVTDDGIHGRELMRIDREPGTTEILGAGCGASAPHLESGDWMAGRSTLVRGENPTTSPGFLIVGVVAAPIQIPSLLAPDCCLWSDLRNIALLPQGATGGSWTRTFQVPNGPIFTGQRYLMQAVYGPGPLALSNGLQLYVGR